MDVLITGDNEFLTGRIRETVIQEGYVCPASNVMPCHQAMERHLRSQPEVTVVALSANSSLGWVCVEEARSGKLGRVIVVGSVADGRRVVQAMRCGIQDYVDEESLETDLRVSLSRVKQELDERPSVDLDGKIVACVPASGGCGASTIAVNLATALARQHKESALIDLRLEAGDLAPLLDLKPLHTLADFCDNWPQLDQGLLTRCMVKHASGVNLLAAPKQFHQIAHLTPDAIRDTLLLARSSFPFVVADLGHPSQSLQSEAVRLADVVLLVFRLDFTSLCNAHRILDYMTEIGVERDRIQLIANRCGQPREIPTDRAAQVLGVPSLFYIPEDLKTVNIANNNGTPVLLDAPSSRISKSLFSLAMAVNGSNSRRKPTSNEAA